MRAGLLVSFGLLFGVLAVEAAPAVSSAAGGQVCMGVVVDDGSGGAPSPQAAQVSPGTTDLEALGAVGETATQNNSGLVCAINGYPANGLQSCTTVAGGQYYYWSYWQGDPYSNTWTYSQVGPSSHAVSQGQTYVEGWRYQNPGPDNASAPKPAITPAAAFAVACPGVTPASSSGGGSSGGAATGPTSGSGADGLGSSGSSAVSPGATVPTTAPPSSSAATAPSAALGQGRNARGAVAGPTSTTSSLAAPGASSNGDGGSPATTPGAQKAKGRAAAALASSTPHGGSGGEPILPLVLVAVVIAAIGGLTLYRWRRRPAEE